MMQAPQNSYLAGLLEGHPLADRGDALNRLRASAVERVGVLSLPSTRDEDWRFTDLAPLTKLSFQPYRGAPAIAESDIARYAIAEAAHRLVFVDGVYAPSLSSPLAGAIVVSSLAAALPAQAAAIEAELGRRAFFENNAFTALNTAFLNDGALVLLPRNAVLDTPVHLLFVATRKEAASYPRCLVLAAAGSQATVVEEYIALNEDAYLTNAVGEFVLADNARLTHVRVQRESRQAFHIGHTAVSLAHGSRYQGIHAGFGARLSRFNLDVTQNAEGAECEIGGLAIIDGSQLADTHSSIDHTKPHGISRQQLEKMLLAQTERA